MGNYVVTGGASGIGAAITERLRGQGHSVCVVDLRDADIVADLATPEGRQSAIKAITAACDDSLDGLVPCAGLASSVPDGSLIARVNYYGTVELVEGLKPLLAAARGIALLVSSNSAPMPTDDAFVDALLDGDQDTALKIAAGMQSHPVYSGSKQAVARWMRRNTPAFAAEGVRLNAIAPGYTRTAMTAAVEKDPVYAEGIRQFLASIPLQRPGMPEDIADAAEFLLSDKASFICGAMLYIDGGHDALLRPDAI